MTVALPTSMSPLVISGAASVANLLISGVGKALGAPSVTASTQAPLAKGFDHALYKAAGSGMGLAGSASALNGVSPVEFQKESILRMPEVQSALAAQPAGSVTGIEVRQDGSVALSTARGAVEVSLSQASRESSIRAFSTLAEAARNGGVGGVQALSVLSADAGGFPRAEGFVLPLSGGAR
jgi:hypothetical protein